MRRIRNLILAAVLAVSLIFPAAAAENGTQYSIRTNATEVIYFKANSSSVQIKQSRDNPISQRNIVRRKVYTYCASNGEVLWQVTLHARFRHTPAGLRCLETDCDVETFDDRWYLVTKDVQKNVSFASGEVVMGRTFLGVPVDRETVRMILTNSDESLY